MSSEIVYRSCPTCEASCGLKCEIDREARRVIRIEGDPDDPRSRGYLCPKAYAMKEIYEDPERLRQPIRKRGDGSWEELEWDEALDYCATRLREIRDTHGPNANGYYIGNPTGHMVGGQLYIPPLVNALGSERGFSAATMDQFPQNVALQHMIGDSWFFPIPDIDHTDYFVCMGGNPLISQGSLMSAPNAKKRLAQIRERGKLVVIDPRRSETAQVASEHLFIKPGSDAYFLLSVCHVLFEEKLVDPGRLADFTDGIDTIGEIAREYSPEAVASATGIDPHVTRRLVREFCGAKGAWYGRIGLCTQEFGTLASWLVYVVNALTGRLDAEGGMMFPRPASGKAEAGRPFEEFVIGDYKTAKRGIPRVAGQLPCGVMAEEIEQASAGDERMRGLVVVCGNPVLSAPNGERLAAALPELDFMVAVDIYLNETTCHADVILPSTVHLESENYDFLFEGTSVRNFARHSPRFFEPEGTLMDHGRILCEIGARISGATFEQVDDLMVKGMLAMMVGPGTGVPDVTPEEALEKLGPERGAMRLVDAMVRVGPYGDKFDDRADGLSMAKVAAAEHGIDLGPLRPRLPEALATPDKRLKLAPEYLLEDLPRLRAGLAARSGENQLVLVGRRQMRNMNSWLHNLPALAKGKDRCVLLISPKDATRLGIGEGSRARIRSRVGSVEAQCRVTDEMMPGVVSLPHGFGHRVAGIRMSVAAEKQPGPCSNHLTDEIALDVPSGSHVANGIPVEVAAI
jgi:anaerobic selenocysteine-containing dehydrogenase